MYKNNSQEAKPNQPHLVFGKSVFIAKMPSNFTNAYRV